MKTVLRLLVLVCVAVLAPSTAAGQEFAALALETGPAPNVSETPSAAKAEGAKKGNPMAWDRTAYQSVDDLQRDILASCVIKRAVTINPCGVVIFTVRSDDNPNAWNEYHLVVLRAVSKDEVYIAGFSKSPSGSDQFGRCVSMQWLYDGLSLPDRVSTLELALGVKPEAAKGESDDYLPYRFVGKTTNEERCKGWRAPELADGQPVAETDVRCVLHYSYFGAKDLKKALNDVRGTRERQILLAGECGKYEKKSSDFVKPAGS